MHSWLSIATSEKSGTKEGNIWRLIKNLLKDIFLLKSLFILIRKDTVTLVVFDHRLPCIDDMSRSALPKSSPMHVKSDLLTRKK